MLYLETVESPEDKAGDSFYFKTDCRLKEIGCLVIINYSMIKKIELYRKIKALVIVAHPDDETIFMGCTIMTYPEIDWTIFSLCRASDIDRAPKFKRVCKFYNAQSIITDLEDEDKLSIKKTIPIIKKNILEKVGKKKFDFVFTHGENGEYCHPRHLGVYQAIKELSKKNELKAKVTLHFNYKKISRKEFSPFTFKKNSDILVKLDRKMLNKKKSVMTNIYGFSEDGVDTSYCTSPEAFKLIVNNK